MSSFVLTEDYQMHYDVGNQPPGWEHGWEHIRPPLALLGPGRCLGQGITFVQRRAGDHKRGNITLEAPAGQRHAATAWSPGHVAHGLLQKHEARPGETREQAALAHCSSEDFDGPGVAKLWDVLCRPLAGRRGQQGSRTTWGACYMTDDCPSKECARKTTSGLGFFLAGPPTTQAALTIACRPGGGRAWLSRR
ncbi:hypothetical protein OPQ81_000092 [Rhizoctonia solani]|nr:hypothetical protein OPQ81_000092 [Rhizoctonia solani]